MCVGRPWAFFMGQAYATGKARLSRFCKISLAESPARPRERLSEVVPARYPRAQGDENLLRLLEFFQLFNQVAQLLAVLALIRRHLRRGFRHDERVGDPFLLHQQIHIPENRLG